MKIFVVTDRWEDDDHPTIEFSKFFTTREAAEEYKVQEDARRQLKFDVQYEEDLKYYEQRQAARDALTAAGIDPQGMVIGGYYKPEKRTHNSWLVVEELEVQE